MSSLLKSYDIDSVYSVFQKSVGGVQRERQELLMDCIYHAGESTKLSVNPKKGLYQCWVCGAKGTVSKLLQDMLKKKMLSIRDISRINRKKIAPNTTVQEEVSDRIDCVLPYGAVPIQDMKEDYLKSKARAYTYLHGRGLTDEDIVDYKLHLCPAGSFYAGRIIAPVYGLNGQLRNWMARTFINDEPKMLNGSKKYTPFPSSKTLFNEERINENEAVTVTEGMFDAISVTKSGVSVGVALQGKELSAYHLLAIRRGKPSVVFICLDGGEEKASLKMAARLSTFYLVFIVSLPEGKDPNDCTEKELWAAFWNAALYNTPEEA